MLNNADNELPELRSTLLSVDATLDGYNTRVEVAT